jgi:hypothetical protein
MLLQNQDNSVSAEAIRSSLPTPGIEPNRCIIGWVYPEGTIGSDHP